MRIALRILMICSAILLLGNSCQSFKDFQTARDETQAKKEQRKAEYAAKLEAEEKAKAAEAAPVPIPVLDRDSILFQFERRPCFGRCPVYKIRIYESGYTTYDGVNFVDHIGYYKTRISQSEIAQIYTLIASSNFFELEDEYDNENISDLPSMIFRAKAMGQDKRIVARYEFPDALKDLAKDIDQMFEGRDWQAVD